MLKNDGTQTNEKVYWDCFQRVFGNAGDEEQALFMNYYLNEYQDCLKESCGKIDGAAAVVHGLREKGILLALATNPLFPIEAVSKRIAFSGLSPDDFDCVTTYDWCRFSKPNPNYYLEVSKKLSVPPEQCLMVGNDAADDMPAESIGMQTFLVTDCLEHTTTEDIQNHPHGTMKDLLDFIQSESA